jgi:hypothetical protein
MRNRTVWADGKITNRGMIKKTSLAFSLNFYDTG